VQANFLTSLTANRCGLHVPIFNETHVGNAEAK
jgi:hypothetical protein